MTFQKRFDKIISLIEENIEKKYSEIGDAISNALGFNKRTVFEVFKFVTDYTFADYVGQRRMEYIFNWKKEHGCAWPEAAFQYGEEYTSFYRRFKSIFPMSPAEAIDNNDEITFLRPLTIESLMLNKGETKDMVMDKQYISPLQISYEQFLAIDEIQNNQALYGLDGEEAVKLFNLANKYGISMNEICECREVEKLYSDYFMYEEVPIADEIMGHAKGLADSFGYSIVEVYYHLREEHSIAFIHLMEKYNHTYEDAKQFSDSMEDDCLEWEDITEEVRKLYFSEYNQWFYVGDYISVAECIEILTAAEKYHADVWDDPGMLVWIGDGRSQGKDWDTLIREYANEQKNFDKMDLIGEIDYYEDLNLAPLAWEQTDEAYEIEFRYKSRDSLDYETFRERPFYDSDDLEKIDDLDEDDPLSMIPDGWY